MTTRTDKVDLSEGIKMKNKNRLFELSRSVTNLYRQSTPGFEPCPRLARSYAALDLLITNQFEYVANQVVVMFTATDPYSGSRAMFNDIERHNRLKVYRTNPDDSTCLPDSHPMMATDSTGLRLNDKFRAVHDYIGHYQPGHSFNPLIGESRAFLAHLATFVGPVGLEARAALMRETILQSLVYSYTGQFSDGRCLNEIGPIDEKHIIQELRIGLTIFDL